MRWDGDRESDNVEDRRGLSMGGRGLAAGGIGTLVITLIALYFGVGPSVILNQVATAPPAAEQQQAAARSPEENKLAQFSSVVLAARTAQAGFANVRFETVFEIVKEAGGGTRTNPVFLLMAQRG
jgi:predicted metalloprotease